MKNDQASYTVDSVERALVHHCESGRLKSWVRLTTGTTPHRTTHRIDFYGGGGITTRNLRETYLVVAGLASAGFAAAALSVGTGAAR